MFIETIERQLQLNVKILMRILNNGLLFGNDGNFNLKYLARSIPVFDV